jgi:hypothetical protein
VDKECQSQSKKKSIRNIVPVGTGATTNNKLMKRKKQKNKQPTTHVARIEKAVE